jgi:hypothetical protein
MNLTTRTFDMPSEFSLEELAWMHADGRMDATLTEITALTDDAEFEEWIFMLRLCRGMASIHRKRSFQRQTEGAAKRLQIILAACFRISLSLLDSLFCVREKLSRKTTHLPNPST